MTFKRISSVVVVACALGWAGPADAARNPGRARTDGRLEQATGGVARSDRDAHFQAAPAAPAAAFARLEAEVGPLFATWDAATQIPHRLLLAGVDAPGSVTDAGKAEAFARDLLVRHLALLAPGSAPSDFVLVSNETSAGIRSVGFRQHHRGAEVLGGQISFRFKHDRLVMIGSDAYPDVGIASRSRTPSSRAVVLGARDWVTDDVPGVLAKTGPVEGPFVLPLVDASGSIEYREVWRTSLDLVAPQTRWQVYLDAGSGAPIARQQMLLYGTGQLLFDVPQRSPQTPRVLAPADTSFLTVDGLEGTTDAAGFFDFAGDTATLETTLAGPFARVQNDDGPDATIPLSAASDDSSVWQDLTETVDAQLSAYVHTMIVKNHVRTVSDESWLDEQIPVIVNIADTCNAFSDGNSINFFKSGGGCENTALLADVVYHEFGHSIHSQSVIAGVGQFNVSLSEGISDYLSATITGDSALARGFFMSDQPLREIDPEGFEYRWPDDRGEVHDEGRIIAGALWDLRTRLIGKYGEAQGRAVTDRIWFESTRRAVDIPSMYPEALLIDDDDGDLTNGTPNACEINAAYGPHGLFNPGPSSERVSMTPDAAGPTVSLELALPSFPQCPIAAAPTVSWRVRGSTDATEVAMVTGAAGSFVAQLPPQPAGTVLELQIHPGYEIDPGRSLPDNIVDPWYQMFIGDVIELGCIEADTDAMLGDDWALGPWADTGSGSDPTAPYGDGTHVWQAGTYRPGTASVTFGAIDTGPFTQLRLQFRRWLAVEDGFFDSAYIEVNGQRLWQNFASAEDYLATFHHIDKEWRFVDFDISEFAGPEGIALSFGTRADGGLEFGGWSLAEVCVVAFDGPPPGCGDGALDAPAEACDDGNVAPGDGCDASCQLEPEQPDPEGPQGDGGDDPDGPDDTGDDGMDDEGEPSLDGDGLLDRGCACSSTESPAGSGAALLLLLFGLRRRRRS